MEVEEAVDIGAGATSLGGPPTVDSIDEAGEAAGGGDGEEDAGAEDEVESPSDDESAVGGEEVGDKDPDEEGSVSYSSDDDDDDRSSSGEESDDDDDEEEAGANEGLSHYERLRLERIARNNARLASLGFSETLKNKKERKKAPYRPRKSLEPAGPRRQLPGRAGRATFNESATLASARKAKKEKQEKSSERKEKKKVERKNLDACWACQKEEGELRCCDYCRKLYHPQCHVPPIQPDDDEFKCNLCEKAGRTRRVACGKCEGCTRETDCMTCVACYNKYEGNGKTGKCIFRKCRSWGKANLICATSNNNDSTNKTPDEVGEKEDGDKKNEDGDRGEEDDDDNDTRSHDDECFVCGNGGDLICCDSCPKVYHSNCHKPKIHILPEGEWNCQHCVKEKAAAAAAQKAKEKKRPKYTGTLVADLGHKEVKCTIRFPKIECTVCHEVEVTGAFQPPGWVTCSCNDSYHLKCLDPPLQTRPSNWRCPSCKEKKAKVKKDKVKKEKEESRPLFEGEHDDYCFMCYIGGDLLCCDFCSKAYHLECHLPPLLEIPPGIWKCQECAALEYVRKFKCGECKACLREDCGKCSMCLDKPKFGGPNKMKQVCVHKKCPYMRFAKPNKATLQSKKTKKELKLQFKEHSSSSPPTSNKKKKKSMDNTVKSAQTIDKKDSMLCVEIKPKEDSPNHLTRATPQTILKEKEPRSNYVEGSPSLKKRKISGGGGVDASQAADQIGSEVMLGSPDRKSQAFLPFKGQKAAQPSSVSDITSIGTGDLSRDVREVPAQENDAKEQKDTTLKEIKKLLERPLKNDTDGNKMRNIIINALRNPDNSKEQDKACEHLRLLATSTNNVAKIILLGGLKVVLQAMKNHSQNSTVQVEACTFLIELIVVQPSCTAAIVQERCLQLTASSMQCHGTHLKVQQMACGLFRAMSYDFENHSSIAVIGVEAVTDAMKRNPRKHDIFKESCYFLQNLFCNPEIESGAIKAVLSKGTILHIIDTLVEDVQFFELGCVLTNLATNERAKAHIGSYDLSVPTALLTVLSPGVYADACKCSLDVLTFLATGSEENTSKIAHLGGIQKVMDFLKPLNDVGLANTGLKLLAKLTKENGDNAQLLINTDGLGLVTRFMMKYPNFPNIQASSCGLLRNLKQGLFEIDQANDSVRLILAAMNAHKKHKLVQFEACHALLQYCSCFPAIAESMQSKGDFPIKPDDMRLSKRKQTPSPKHCKSSDETTVEADQSLSNKGSVPISNGRSKEPGVLSSSEIESIMKSKPLKGDPVGNKIRLITVKALKNHDNSKYQDKACEILRRHAKSAGNASKIIRHGGLKVVSKAMKDHSHKSIVQAEACALLAELAWVNPSCVTAIAEEGCLQLALTSMQHHGTNLKVQQMACGFFRAMSYDFENHQIINNVNGAGAIIDAMKRNPKKYNIFKEACYFLQNMLCNPNILPEIIELIVSNGTVPIIVHAMCEKTHDSDFASAACGVLANLAIDERAREHIGGCDLSIPTLLSVIASGIDPDASKCSLNCLSLLASGDDGNIAKVISLCGIKTLMDFLTPPNNVVLADSGMRLLTELTKNSQENSQLLLDAGGFDFLSTEMKNNADLSYLQARACGVLRYLPVGVDKVNVAIGLILRAMKTHSDDEVQYEGCHALLRYCCLFPTATAGLMKSEEAGPILAQSQFQMPHHQ